MEVRNSRPRIGSAREISLLTQQNPRDLIERAKMGLELQKSSTSSATSCEPSPGVSEDEDDQSTSEENPDDDVIQSLHLEAHLRDQELNDLR